MKGKDRIEIYQGKKLVFGVVDVASFTSSQKVEYTRIGVDYVATGHSHGNIHFNVYTKPKRRR